MRKLTITVILLLIGVALFGQAKRAIEPRDCVTVRHLTDDYFHGAIQINPQGTRVAYLVQSPNLAANRNDIELYVRDLPGSPRSENKLLVRGPSVSQLKWQEDGRHLTLLAENNGLVAVVQIDAVDNTRQVLVTAVRDIKEYSISSAGDVIVFALEDKSEPKNSARSESQIDSGYRITLEQSRAAFTTKRMLYVTRRLNNEKWTGPEQITFPSATAGQFMSEYPYILSLHLALSPDGRFVLITYIEFQIPESWKKSPYLQPSINPVGVVSVTTLLDLSTHEATIPIKTPYQLNVPLWASDSRSFIVTAQAPANSRWEQEDIQNHKDRMDAIHLFWVDINTGNIEKIIDHVANGAAQPLVWKKDGSLLLHTSENEIAEFGHQDGKWIEISSFHIPLPHFFRFAELASDGRLIVGDYQNSLTPPELFLYDHKLDTTLILAKLNPQFDDLTVAPMKEIQWTTSTGYDVHGLLFLPPGYAPGSRYPLVIQTKPDNGWFVCDSGEDHDPSFAPQPIANAGMMYLIRTYPEDWRQQNEVDHYPRGYPGGIGEAAFQMDLWDSAVDALDVRGLIDRTSVGIIGFSRSGWYTEFILAHSKNHYRAATVADNVTYSLGEYWLAHDRNTLRAQDVMYGGPPYGVTLKNWLDYSISFNLDRIHTPLLMEEMGYGIPYSHESTPPLNLAMSFEVFTGLHQLGRPVELFYYENEVHQPEHPKARLASLQRNLDWYRFWLQDYERPDPEDPDQYTRWRKMRETLAH